MGVVDDVHDGFVRDGGADTYSVSDTRRGRDTAVGVLPPETLQQLIEEHPDACRAFQMTSGDGYVDPSRVDGDLSRAEHAGRIEIEPEELLGSLSSELCSCQVRLDTSAPQLVTVTESSGRKEIEIDDTVARIVSPPSDDPAE